MVYIRCPYYIREERKPAKKIVCEAVCGENGSQCSSQQIFGDLKELKNHRDVYCKGNWGRCPIAGALNRKYAYEI